MTNQLLMKELKNTYGDCAFNPYKDVLTASWCVEHEGHVYQLGRTIKESISFLRRKQSFDKLYFRSNRPKNTWGLPYQQVFPHVSYRDVEENKQLKSWAREEVALPEFVRDFGVNINPYIEDMKKEILEDRSIFRSFAGYSKSLGGRTCRLNLHQVRHKVTVDAGNMSYDRYVFNETVREGTDPESSFTEEENQFLQKANGKRPQDIEGIRWFYGQISTGWDCPFTGVKTRYPAWENAFQNAYGRLWKASNGVVWAAYPLEHYILVFSHEEIPVRLWVKLFQVAG